MRELGHIVDEHYASVHRFLRVVSGSCALADDLAQDTFAQLAKRGTAGIQDARNYVMRTAYTCWARSISKKSAPVCSLSDFDIADPEPFSQQQVERAEAMAILRASLADMPLDLRAVVVLVSLEACSFADAAEVLGVPRTTLVSRHKRGLEWLYGKLKGAVVWVP